MRPSARPRARTLRPHKLVGLAAEVQGLRVLEQVGSAARRHALDQPLHSRTV